MKKEMNNKGFSLVELIIVIAIMAVLVGLLAPQYLKYVNNSKVSADVTNAQALATAFNVALADGGKVEGTWSGNGNTTIDAPSGLNLADAKLNITEWPETKLSTGQTWEVKVGANGVEYVKLGTGTTNECYPNPDDSTTGYNNNKK